MSKKSNYKKIMSENTFVQVPREVSGVIANTSDAYDFFTSRKVFGKKPVSEKVARPFSQHLRNAQEEVEYMISHGPTPDGDDGVYDNPKMAMKLLSVAQKALGRIK